MTGRPSEGSLLDRVLSHGCTRPSAEALICGDTSLTWAELRARVLALAGALDARISDRTRITLLGDVSAQMVTAFLAIVASGRCAVPLQTSAHLDSLLRMIEDADVAGLIVDRRYLAALGDRLSSSISVHLTESIGEDTDASIPLSAARIAEPNDAFNIIYSSGTTGQPKGIVQPHRMRFRQATRDEFDLSPDSTLLLATPLYSNTTLMPMLATLFHGGRVVMMPRFDAGAYLDLAERLRATHTMLVPVQYQRILNHPGFAGRDLSSFELKQSTGAPLQAADKLRVAREWPGRFIEVYGLTEGGCTCILDVTARPDKAHTVGKPAPGNDIRVIDEGGRDMPTGKRGEIVGRSAMMMSGYFRRPDATQGFLWRDAAGTAYHRTGDIGAFDEDGFLTLVERKKDVIISGGFNIYASDLEAKLLAHPDVAEAAVIAVPSDRWGETPIGVVVLCDGRLTGAGEILDWTNERLGKTQRLSTVEIAGSLPRNAVGKVLKQDLRRRYTQETR